MQLLLHIDLFVSLAKAALLTSEGNVLRAVPVPQDGGQTMAQTHQHRMRETLVASPIDLSESFAVAEIGRLPTLISSLFATHSSNADLK